MRYSVEFKVSGERLNDLVSILKSEKNASRSRSKFDIKKDGEYVVFNITAQDATALRATLNTITTNLQIFEKSLNLGREK